MLYTECATKETSLLTVVVEEGNKEGGLHKYNGMRKYTGNGWSLKYTQLGPLWLFLLVSVFLSRVMFVNDVCQLNIDKWSM